MKAPSIGVVSEGTLRQEDLLSAFVSAVEDLIEDDDDRAMCGQLLISAHRYMDMDALSEDGAEEVSSIIEELEDLLNGACPPYIRFSAQDGDGACFGFWPDVDCAILDAENGEILRSNGSVPDLLLDVNDHGNVTLYEVSLKEIWSTV